MISNRIFLITAIVILFSSCQDQRQSRESENSVESNKIEAFYQSNKGDNQPSRSLGTVANGSLENGKLMPFAGNNFQYFDTTSYLIGRAFIHDKVKKSVLETYTRLEDLYPNRKFGLMECANEKGGKLFPHRTHQNGLSVDFMMPLIKDGKPYYKLDYIGPSHYWLEFDEDGKYEKDKSVSIDFEVVASHILELHRVANKHGLRIKKVIIKIELKDELFDSELGKELMKSDIYIVKALTPMINALHDDHFHIDFEVI